MEDKAGMNERHRMLSKPPSNDEFKEGDLFNVLFDFIGDYVVKLYGINKVRATMVANPGYGLIDVVTASDLAYVVAVIEDKKGVWEQTVHLKRMTQEERFRVKDLTDFAVEEPRFTSRKGVKKEYLGNGWSKEGIQMYNDVWKKWKEKFRDEVFWDLLGVAWELYESEKEVAKMWRKTVSCHHRLFKLCCHYNYWVSTQRV